MDALTINDQVVISAQYLSADAVRSSGPGGQNVNKLSTKVVLTLNLSLCPTLDDDVKQRLRALIGKHTNKDGQPVVTCQSTRYRERNLEIAREKLANLIRRALIVPIERRETKPTKGSQERRLQIKRRQSDKKSLRRDIKFE